MFHTDAWLWKIALLLALVGVREFVRLASGPSAVKSEASGAAHGGVARNGAEESENTRWLIETLDSAVIAIGLVLFIIQPFLVQAFYIPSSSMEDTLRIDDRLLVSKFVYRLRDPKAGEVVVFKPPPEADAAQNDDFIKRCVGAPGDVVYIKGRRFYRNGKLLNEPYVKWSSSSYSYDMKIVGGKIYTREHNTSYPFNASAAWVEAGHGPIALRLPALRQSVIENAPPEAVPPGKFLMLGDHRDNSNDGHAWGFVLRRNIVGKAFCVFWPPTRLGVLDRMSDFPRPAQRAPLPQLSP